MSRAARVRIAAAAALCAAAAVLPAADAAVRTCPLVTDATGDVAPGLLVVPAGDEAGLDIVAADISVRKGWLSAAMWLEQLDGTVPRSGSGVFYNTYFRIGRATLFTHVYHWPLNTSFDAGWIDEEGRQHFFSRGRAGGTYDPETGVVSVGFDVAVMADNPIPGDPVVREGTVVSGLVARASRTTPAGGTVADEATTRATYRVGQKACPRYR